MHLATVEVQDGSEHVLEDPGRFYWKWIAVATVLLIVYAIERTVRTGSLF